MLSDADDLAPAELLADVLPTMFYSSLVVADKDGVHWRSVKAAARVIKTLAENSPNSEANFAFAASALVPPGTPFYPGGYYLGPGQDFAVALESASVVAEAFASAPRDPARTRQALEESLGAPARRIEAGDMATLAVKLGKPLSARLMPVKGKGKGDRTSFQDPSMVNTTLQPLP
jgi:uncharacterized protein (UPF0210 family)